MAGSLSADLSSTALEAVAFAAMLAPNKKSCIPPPQSGTAKTGWPTALLLPHIAG